MTQENYYNEGIAELTRSDEPYEIEASNKVQRMYQRAEEREIIQEMLDQRPTPTARDFLQEEDELNFGPDVPVGFDEFGDVIDYHSNGSEERARERGSYYLKTLMPLVWIALKKLNVEVPFFHSETIKAMDFFALKTSGSEPAALVDNGRDEHFDEYLDQVDARMLVDLCAFALNQDPQGVTFSSTLAAAKSQRELIVKNNLPVNNFLPEFFTSAPSVSALAADMAGYKKYKIETADDIPF